MGVVAEVIANPQSLVGLHPLEYEHSLDSQALEALKATPGLEMLDRQIVKHGVERMFSVQLEGSNIRISERNHRPGRHGRTKGTSCFVVLYSGPATFLKLQTV